jgi:hypothetical protein
MLNMYIKPPTIYSWETDIDIFAEQERSKNTDTINFNFGDVKNCEPTNYMDIDLKCSYKTCRNMIMSLFEKQKCLTGDKIFHFSYSVNWLDAQSVDNVIINSLQDLIGKNIFLAYKRRYVDKKISIREYLIGNCGKFIVRAFWYYDSSPMVSISIFSSDKTIYKTRNEKINYIHNVIGADKYLENLSDEVLDLHVALYVLQSNAKLAA